MTIPVEWIPVVLTLLVLALWLAGRIGYLMAGGTPARRAVAVLQRLAVGPRDGVTVIIPRGDRVDFRYSLTTDGEKAVTVDDLATVLAATGVTR